MMEVDTRGGVFGGGGYGGGVFDGSYTAVAGLGGVGAAYEQAAAGVGVAPLPPVRAFREGSLGRVTQSGVHIPDECYDIPDFVDCGARQIRAAAAACENDKWRRLGYDDYWACEMHQTDVAAANVCVPQFCATGERIPIEQIQAEDEVDYPWGKYSQMTCGIQRDANEWLEAEGFQKLAVDCKLGAKTCGAARAAPFVYDPESCRSFEEPVPASAAPPPPAPMPAPPPVELPPVGPTKAGMSGWLIGGLIAAGVAGAAAIAMSKKKKRR